MMKDERLFEMRVFFLNFSALRLRNRRAWFLRYPSSTMSARRVRDNTPDGIERFESGQPMDDCRFIC
jgi:hypothetical protein